MTNKLFTGFAMFDRHLRIAALGLLAFGGIGAALHTNTFAFSWPALARFDHSLAYAVLAATVWRHLCAATPLSRRLLAGGMACLLLAALGLQLGLQWQSHKRLGQGTLYLIEDYFQICRGRRKIARHSASRQHLRQRAHAQKPS